MFFCLFVLFAKCSKGFFREPAEVTTRSAWSQKGKGTHNKVGLKGSPQIYKGQAVSACGFKVELNIRVRYRAKIRFEHVKRGN